MLSSLLTYTHFFRLDMDWQAWIVRGVRRSASLLDLPDLVASCDQAMTHIDAAFALRDRFRLAQKPTLGSGEARELDHAIDECLGGVFRGLEALAGISRSPFAEAARRALEAAFPSGLRAHVNAPWTEQAYLNERAIKALRAPEHEGIVSKLGIVELIDAIAPKVERFSVLVAASVPVTGAAVSAAEDRAEQATLHMIFRVISTFSWDDPAEVERRDLLLLPLRAANAELHRLYVARKGAKSKAPVCDPADAAAAPSVEPPADLDAFPPAPDVIVPSDEGILLPTGT